MINSVHDYHVHDLLSPENPLAYHVPVYQREYTWSRSEWEDLYNDLAEAEGEHFLGTIICLNRTVDAVAGGAYELIDGQQRMTTLSLLLAAIYAELNTHRSLLDEDELTDLVNLRKSLVIGKENGNPRVRPQKQNSNLSDYLVVLKEAGLPIAAPAGWYVGVRRIKKCYAYFQQALRGDAERGSRELVDRCLAMLTRVKQALLVVLEVQSHSDAYVLFESLNNRGVPLTPIDLIKNALLARSEKTGEMTVDDAFERWNDLLEDLGDDPNVQERFFRHYYNAFKSSLVPVTKATVATKSNLIRIYEAQIDAGVAQFLERLLPSGRDYRRILGRLSAEEDLTVFDTSLTHLRRAQGAPSFVLLLYAMWHQGQLGLTEQNLADIARLLAKFFVRRNLTGTPQTYSLPTLFMNIIATLEPLRGDDLVGGIRDQLMAVSASDEEFKLKLEGPVYEDNVEVTRYLLASLAEQSFTKEHHPDLWARTDRLYVWTIEHILPQGQPLPDSWAEMLGGATEAADVQGRLVHTLGNLTLTGYNSNLGNRSFEYKRDRADAKGNPIGYRNGLNLNEDVVDEPTWGEAQIRGRSARLIARIMASYSLESARAGQPNSSQAREGRCGS